MESQLTGKKHPKHRNDYIKNIQEKNKKDRKNADIKYQRKKEGKKERKKERLKELLD